MVTKLEGISGLVLRAECASALFGAIVRLVEALMRIPGVFAWKAQIVPVCTLVGELLVLCLRS